MMKQAAGSVPFIAACCLAGLAGVPRASVDIVLVGRMHLPNSLFLTNVVGYVDSGTSREYAILGDDHDRVYIVDVTDPTAPRLAAQVSGVPGFDVKTWDHYLYTCDGNTSGFDSRIVDLADPTNPQILPNGFASAHTLQIAANGIMFAEYPGLRLYDLAVPTAPALLYETGGEGHDSTPRGTRLYDFHGRDGTVIWDVSNPSDPDTLGVIDDPTIVFHHSGDVTPDERFLYICDELMTGPGADISIWDIVSAAAPVRVGQIADVNSSVHNIYIVGTLAYVAYYAAGFRVYDVTDPVHPVLAGAYDTSKRSGEGFIGAIGAYAYSPSGNIFVCDIENGLFIFSVTPTAASPSQEDAGFVLEQNAPNPFNPSTRIPFELTRGGRVTLDVYDVQGRRVRQVLNRVLPAGTHDAEWDGRDDTGRSVASGVYFYRMASLTRVETRRMVLLK
jgi:choice-of-anchor B domain-containing protein